MTNLLVGLAVFAWLISRQLAVRPLRDSARAQWVLLTVGVVQTVSYLGPHGGGGGAIVLLTLSALIGAALAAVRARTIRIWSTPTGMFRQGTWVTAGLWVAGLGQHLLIDVWAGDHGLGTASLLAYFGLVLLVQRLALLHRAGVEGHRAAVVSSRS